MEISREEKYILYFGRFQEEKGIGTLLEVCKQLPDINFIFAGSWSIRGKGKYDF